MWLVSRVARAPVLAVQRLVARKRHHDATDSKPTERRTNLVHVPPSIVETRSTSDFLPATWRQRRQTNLRQQGRFLFVRFPSSSFHQPRVPEGTVPTGFRYPPPTSPVPPTAPAARGAGDRMPREARHRTRHNIGSSPSASMPFSRCTPIGGRRRGGGPSGASSMIGSQNCLNKPTTLLPRRRQLLHHGLAPTRLTEAALSHRAQARVVRLGAHIAGLVPVAQVLPGAERGRPVPALALADGHLLEPGGAADARRGSDEGLRLFRTIYGPGRALNPLAGERWALRFCAERDDGGALLDLSRRP